MQSSHLLFGRGGWCEGLHNLKLRSDIQVNCTYADRRAVRGFLPQCKQIREISNAACPIFGPSTEAAPLRFTGRSKAPSCPRKQAIRGWLKQCLSWLETRVVQQIGPLARRSPGRTGSSRSCEIALGQTLPSDALYAPYVDATAAVVKPDNLS
jgi:hypothetical protein